MRRYAEYEFYQGVYHGERGFLDFDRNILPVTQYIRYLTMGKADHYTGEELKYAACEAVDILCEASDKKVRVKKAEKKSETTDGYSVSYVTEGKDGETTEELENRRVEAVKQRMRAAVQKWLLPTGLLYRGVGCGHAHKYGRYDI